MRRVYIVILCMIFMVSAAAFLPAEPISLAVTQIVPIGVDEDTAQLTVELLQTEFSKSPVFRLVERSRLDEILQEQKLSLSGITDADSAVEAGNILNLDRIVFGSLGKYESEYIDYLLSLRLVDVERATVEAADSIQIKKGADLQKTISQIVSRLQGNLRFTGAVTALEGDAVYTSLGEGMGVGPADILGVFKTDLIKDDKGSVIMREETSVANLVVEQVSPEGSKCKILESSGKLSKGLLVRKGRITLQEAGTGGSLAVETIPEGAKVFLGREFIGVTPLNLERIEPGEYSVEIRGGGYKSYKEKINVSARKTAKLDVELEEEISTGELLLLGKVPRQETDPAAAMKKALLPGAGHIYNGYTSTGLIIPAGMLLSFSFGGLMAANYLEDRKGMQTAEEPGLTADYHTRREYYDSEIRTNMHLMNTLFMAGAGFYSYLFSIADAGMSAGADFLYPTFVELSVGGTGIYTRLSQTEEQNITQPDDFTDAVTGGVSSLFPGGYADIVYRGKKFYAALGLLFTTRPIVIDYRNAYRFQLGDSFLLGPGISVHANLSEPANVNFTETGGDGIKPLTGTFLAPILSFSYLGYSVELDINIAPFAVGSGYVHVLQTGTDWTETAYVPGLYASMAEIGFNWFFLMHTGIRIHARYFYGWDRQSELEKQGFTATGSLHYVTGSVGIVFRL